jgi:hypothetical protein
LNNLPKAAAVALAALLLSCRGGRELMPTAYHEGGASVRYPATWRSEQERRDGVTYRHFLAPPAGADRRPAASVTLLVANLGTTLEDYARVYLDGKAVASSREEQRQGAHGRAYRYASADGANRYSLLLLQEGQRVYGLFGQAASAQFDAHAGAIEAMEKSLTLERPADYPEHRNDKFAFALRVPPSWRSTRTFAGGSSSLTQFSSPPLLVDRNGQTVHASLTVSVEAADGGLDAFYRASRDKLGEAYKVISHEPWKDGFADLESVETPIAASRIKRSYRLAGGRGYTLSCEARDDAYPLVARWCDVIASTLKIGPEVGRP